MAAMADAVSAGVSDLMPPLATGAEREHSGVLEAAL